MPESKIVSANWLCDKCGHPVKLERKESEVGFGSIKNLHICDREPAHVELATLKAQVAEAERRLEEEIRKAVALGDGCSSYGLRIRLFSQAHAFGVALSLLRQAAAGELEIKKEG